MQEEIEDQAKILKLQRELISKQDQEGCAKYCWNRNEELLVSASEELFLCFISQKTDAAVRKVNNKEDKIKNNIIYCVEESENEKLQQKLTGIFDRSGAFCEMQFKIWIQEDQLNYTPAYQILTLQPRACRPFS